MQLALSLSSNTVFLLAILTVLTVTFHIVFIFRRQRTARFWKAVDFVWLFAAVLGVAGAGIKWRQFEAAYKYEEGLLRRAAADSALSGHIRGLTSSNSCELFRAGKQPEASVASTCAHAAHLEELLSRANVAADSSVSDALIEAAARILADKPFEQSSATLSRQIAGSVVSLRDSIRALATERQESQAELYTLAIAPYLLAIALALRFTKATADFRSTPKESGEGKAVLGSSAVPPRASPTALAEGMLRNPTEVPIPSQPEFEVPRQRSVDRNAPSA